MPPSNFKNIHFATVTSTNDAAKVFLLSKNQNDFEKYHYTVFSSDTQTSGRGQGLKKWYSPLGGLWFSIIISDFKEINFNRNSFVNGIVLEFLLEQIVNFFQDNFNLKVLYKFPNDLICEDRKLGGILIENKHSKTLIYSIIGVGINVNNEFDSRHHINGVSLSELLKERINLQDFKNDFILNILDSLR